jgi:voltage-gated potassium channel
MILRDVVESADTAAGRAFDMTSQLLVIASIVTFSIDTLPDLSMATREVLSRFNVFVVIAFTIEYGLRIYASEQRWKYILSFYGLIDLIAILPFYLNLGLDLRSIRVVRVFRVFRLFKLARYNQAVRRLHRALIIAREELILFGGVALVVLYLAAVGAYYFEREVQPEAFGSVFQSLWWATTTLTTVGYGDVYPVTLGGRVFTFIVLVLGLGVIAVPTGLIASALSQARHEDTYEHTSDGESQAE